MFSRRCLYALAACAALNGVSRAADIDLPTGGKVKVVDFERHVMGLVSKVGCNAGCCHGSFQGKNGFRLSLFGYEPAMDFAGLTRDNLGRRVNVVEAGREPAPAEGDRADGRTTAGCGSARTRGSTTCSASGSAPGRSGTPGSGDIEKLDDQPRPTSRCSADGKPKQLNVTATFADGSERRHHPVLRLQDHRRRRRRASRRSGCSRRASRATRASTCCTAAACRRSACWCRRRPARAPTRRSPEVNYIDREVFAKLKMLNMVPSRPRRRRRVPPPRLPSTRSAALPTPDEVRDVPRRQRTRTSARRRSTSCSRTRCTRRCGRPSCRDITGNNTQAAGAARRRRRPKRSARCGTTGSASASPTTCPTTRSSRGILTATSRDGLTPEEWLAYVKKIDEQTAKGFDDRLPGQEDARPVLAAAAAGADRAVGREGGGRVPGRPPRVRPVPQAPDRPLDAGRLLGVRQRLRAGDVRRTTSSAART